MRVKPMVLRLAILVVSATALIGVIKSNVHAAEVNTSQLEDAAQEPNIPAAVFERLGHPDVIITKDDGSFVKTKQTEVVFRPDEIVYDSAMTTNKTKVIIAYGDTYIKE
ncbi:hypothetical protein H1230_00090 [Paenibacillus sp. 19GGS1-52]|uniref:hypothetical protein n=1 Tax=Paenibacillus sp. 19GGS1-52 TaxID=2758563 RepID=UPI001EFC1904|nr:hypothetical protein [Paenibacillus sp. 19GGS1-52]ULO07352.1 hypothetical protein H1230_00090 [Paenibacillus sp. 19GGS1-52]